MEVVGRGRRGIWPERAKDWLDIANIRRALRTRVALRVLGTTPRVQPPASSHPPDTPAVHRRGFCFVMLGKLRTCRIGNGLSCLDCRFYYLSHWRLASVGPHGCCIGGGSRSKAVSVGGKKTARRDPAKSAVSRLTTGRSRHPQIFRRFFAFVRDNVIGDLGALRQAAQPRLLDGRDMDEHVLAPPPTA
jgi:hypothetical protein